ncbi:MAG: 2-amino-3,7-dideoxy-D-threo-hept-6-ulosonate synthase [Elusimicrobiota bacterium]|nr:2-amino-3,7-dideoxy-D-threo-hept-6-ulosonate synthase [Elusimicrobiota bacterium]
MIGKLIRIERIMNRETGKSVIIPMDHGFTMGPIKGLEDMKKTVNLIVEGGANAIILHKGIVAAGHRGSGKDVGLIIHLSGSTSLAPDPNYKVIVCSIEEAIRLGADAVSVHVNLGAHDEHEMIRELGRIGKECQEWGMPLISMMYTRGEKIDDQFNVKYVKHAARVGAELGSDLVKVNYTGSAETFAEVVNGCPVPVLIAGGEKTETELDLFKMVEGSLKAGGKGVSIGRNVFQHENPILIIKAISAMVHQGASVEDAMQILRIGDGS